MFSICEENSGVGEKAPKQGIDKLARTTMQPPVPPCPHKAPGHGPEMAPLDSGSLVLISY
jgi:hypothetical protein